MPDNIACIIGLGNPGAEYAQTRHNVGAWLVDQLANDYNIKLKKESKFHGYTGQGNIEGVKCHLLIPSTYMNDSGRAVASLAKFYKLQPTQLLVAHDELDFEPGDIRLKQGGGHGGHNGLRDTIQCLGNQNSFNRIRIGIGHPGDSNRVSGYVLSKPKATEERHIIDSIHAALRWMPEIMQGQFEAAMKDLHSS